MAHEPETLESGVEAAAIESKPEEIREQMEETRTALTDKLEALEERVTGTVDAVTDSVQSAVQSVKRTFDLKYQVNQRPWIMLGGAVAAGFVLGSLGRKIVSRRARRSTPSASPAGRNGVGPVARFSGSASPSKSPGSVGQLRERFREEIDSLQSAAVGAVMGLARDWLKKVLPPLAPRLEQVMNSATTKMGGEPIDGPVLTTAG